MWPFSDTKTSFVGTTTDRCPVDEETRLAWLKANPGKAHPFQPDSTTLPTPASEAQAGPSRSRYNDETRLSTQREISSIPRSYAPLTNPTAAQAAQPPSTPSSSDGEDSDGKWVYPSAKQFYNAMKRKNQNPRVADMDVVVPIHNAVNEQAWKQILAWERMWSGKGNGNDETKLVSFKGRPRDLTWRAWMNGIAGYSKPFDRHDWTVERNCGEQVRYIIDFYTGRGQTAQSQPAHAAQGKGQGMQDGQDNGIAESFGAAAHAKNGLSFYLDVRPAPSTVQGLAMRSNRIWLKYFGEPGAAPH
ncbi:related to CYT2 - holocytochrome-c1 synthase [Melanopsichium pennsylvanicum]|uniref:Holocytochrome c-type synthase n=2 Tax=Melanopsichium pennsylvanicum TaxID=63383 RepID=A0AAJ5C8M3_9BASI|nr:related to CYT2-holocytochrome-c1 synthase [Melanopsichium pennsylvanicum 4]SNX87718.1 related to CYT2 - holocytochrome-c1 synthase [Melanopsichium pennsylvanicum]